MQQLPVVGQFAKSAARLLRAAGLLFLKLTHYATSLSLQSERGNSTRLSALYNCIDGFCLSFSQAPFSCILFPLRTFAALRLCVKKTKCAVRSLHLRVFVSKKKTNDVRVLLSWLCGFFRIA